MRRNVVIAFIRVGLAALGFSAIITQLADNIQNGKSLVSFFSFFTIESNILAASLLLASGIAVLLGVKKSLFEYLRGAAAVYMTMTGIIYIVLLSGEQSTLLIPWVNQVLHYIMPVGVLIDWLVNPPTQAISYKKALWWVAFPLGYLAYSFIRGSLVDWYPYPFIDPRLNSWSYIVTMCLAISLGVLVLIRLLTLRRPRK